MGYISMPYGVPYSYGDKTPLKKPQVNGAKMECCSSTVPKPS